MALPEPRDGDTALVTGASSGIGTEIARELAQRGHGLTLVARREDRLRELAGELSTEHEVRVEVVAADLSDRGARDDLAAAVISRGLSVSVLVNNAGFGSVGEFADNDRERQVQMVALNCEAIIDLTARYLPSMIEEGSGAVLNIASAAAFQPLPGSATYAASKAFVLHFTEAIHEELKGTGVTATAVCPGPVHTEFVEAAGMTLKGGAGPDFAWTSVTDVAAESVKGVEDGNRTVVPGLFNLAGSIVGRYSPRSLSLPITRWIFKRAE